MVGRLQQDAGEESPQERGRMRIPQVRDFLVDHYFSGNRDTAVCLLGPPGIGKSRACEEAAQIISQRLNLQYVDYDDKKGEEILKNQGEKFFIYHNLPLVELEPSDLVGLPREDSGGFVRFRPLLWAHLMAMNPGILLLDDFLDVQRPDLFSAAYKITFERRCGYIRLHEGVMVVIAANTPEVSSLTQMFPAPLANRLLIVNCAGPTPDEWRDWMDGTYGDRWERRVYVFHKRFEGENYLCQVPKDPETISNFSTPRSNTKAALELPQLKDPKIRAEVLEGLLGPDVGSKLNAFLEVEVDVEQLIQNPDLWGQQSMDAKYMLCLELATWLSRNREREKVVPLLRRMAEDSRQYPLLTFLLMKDDALQDLIATLAERDETDLIRIVDQTVKDKRLLMRGRVR